MEHENEKQDGDTYAVEGTPQWAAIAVAEPFKMSTDVDQLIPALVAAQVKLANIGQNTQGQVGSRFYGYADLAAVMTVVRPALAEQGLFVMHGATTGPADLEITTRIWHASAQWIEGTVTMPVEEATAQKAGSALTYGKRYGVTTLLALATDTDDDGAAASERSNRNREAPPAPMPTIRVNDDGQPLVDIEVHRQIMENASKMTPQQRTEMTAWRTANGIHNMTARMLTAVDAQRVIDHMAAMLGGDPDDAGLVDDGQSDSSALTPDEEQALRETFGDDKAEAAGIVAQGEETPRERRAREAREQVAAQAAATTEPVEQEADGAEPVEPVAYAPGEEPFTDDEDVDPGELLDAPPVEPADDSTVDDSSEE